MSNLKTCPFCGTTLIWETWKSKSNPHLPDLKYWHHKRVGCILDMLEVYPDEVEEWNRRTENADA
jgi:hypothetical protein